MTVTGREKDAWLPVDSKRQNLSCGRTCAHARGSGNGSLARPVGRPARKHLARSGPSGPSPPSLGGPIEGPFETVRMRRGNDNSSHAARSRNPAVVYLQVRFEDTMHMLLTFPRRSSRRCCARLTRTIRVATGEYPALRRELQRACLVFGEHTYRPNGLSPQH